MAPRSGCPRYVIFSRRNTPTKPDPYGLAGLIALSTLFIKQHYVADVIAVIALAGAAWVVFLRNCPRVATPELDRRAAPLLLLGLIGIYGLVVAGLWVAYLMGGET